MRKLALRLSLSPPCLLVRVQPFPSSPGWIHLPLLAYDRQLAVAGASDTPVHPPRCRVRDAMCSPGPSFLLPSEHEQAQLQRPGASRGPGRPGSQRRGRQQDGSRPWNTSKDAGELGLRSGPSRGGQSWPAAKACPGRAPEGGGLPAPRRPAGQDPGGFARTDGNDVRHRH